MVNMDTHILLLPFEESCIGIFLLDLIQPARMRPNQAAAKTLVMLPFKIRDLTIGKHMR